MSNSYSVTNHQPCFNSDFSELEIIRTDTNAVVQTYDLTTPTKIKVEAGDYVISQASCSNCYSQSFDSQNDETVTFNGNRMAGVTIIRIEGTLRERKEYTFQLDCCPVFLHFQNGKLDAFAAENSTGSGFDPNCVTIQILEQA